MEVQSPEPAAKPSIYLGKKLILIVFCLVALVIVILTLVQALNELGEKDKCRDYRKWDYKCKSAKRTATKVVVSISVIAILVQLMGLFATYKEKATMLIAHAVLSMVTGLVNIVLEFLFDTDFIWVSLVSQVLVGLMALFFYRDIRRFQHQAESPSVINRELYTINEE